MTAVQTGWEGTGYDPLPSRFRPDAAVIVARALEAPEEMAPEERAQKELDDQYAAWAQAKKLSLEDIMSLDPPEPLIGDNLLYTGTTAWLVGASGTYKSFLALDWACCVATGTSWLGREVKKGRVLYLTLEGSTGFAKRLPAWMSARGADYGALMGSIQFIRDVKFMAQPDKAMIIEDAKRGQYALIVIDTQARATSGATENSKEELDPFVDMLTEISRDTGATILTVHHSTKAGGDALRGHSSIEGAADTVLWLRRPDQESKKAAKDIADPDANLRVDIYVYKQKDTESNYGIPMELYRHEDSLAFTNGLHIPGDPGIPEATGDSLTALQRAILECLDGTGVGDGMTKARIERELKPIAEELGTRTSHSSLMRVINGVVELGWAHMVGGRGEQKQGAEVVLAKGGREWLARLRLGPGGSKRPDYGES